MKKNYWNLTVGVIANLASRVLEISIKPGYAILVKDLPFLKKLTVTNTDYHAVIDKQTYSGIGKQVFEADQLRDNRFQGLKKSIWAMIQLNGIACHQDAVNLYALFEKHGLDLYHYSYNGETTHLNQLIQDLEKPENTTRLQNLNLTEAFTLLKTAQSTFEQLVSGQTEADSVLRGMESASSLYKDLARSLRNYVNYVNTMSGIDSNWTALSLELDQALKAANNTTPANSADNQAEPQTVSN